MMFNDPRNVLMDVEGLEWNPEVPLAKAIQLAKESLENTPSEIDINIKLTGNSAARFHFINTILTALGLPDDESKKFLLQSGIEQQIRALAERSSLNNE